MAHTTSRPILPPVLALAQWLWPPSGKITSRNHQEDNVSHGQDNRFEFRFYKQACPLCLASKHACYLQRHEGGTVSIARPFFLKTPPDVASISAKA